MVLNTAVPDVPVAVCPRVAVAGGAAAGCSDADRLGLLKGIWMSSCIPSVRVAPRGQLGGVN